MRVYHFLNDKYGISSIRERRLKKSVILELNDPFEFFAVELTDKEFRRAMRAAKTHVSEQFGLHCFSKTWRNPVQWAHYSNNHKGLCLGFDVPDHLLEKVKYVPDRLDHNGELNEELVLKLLRTKFEHWEYEKEHRWFVELGKPEDDLYFTNFSDNLSLKQVIVGENSAVTRSQLSEVLQGIENDVQSFKARAGFQNYEMVENQDQRKWA